MIGGGAPGSFAPGGPTGDIPAAPSAGGSWFSFGIGCDCNCVPPCDWSLIVKVDRCPPVYNIPQVEEYTFTFDGPGGEHVVTVDKIDKPDQASGAVLNAAPGTWTVTVSGPAGTCVVTVEVEECREAFVQLHAMHLTALGCLGALEGVDWSVAGPGVGTPSSGTTGADGKYQFLLCADGEYTVSLEPPSGSFYEAAAYTLEKLGLSCPKWTGGAGQVLIPDGYLCGCKPCPWPVKDDLLLTTKYGTFPFSHAAALGPGTSITVNVLEGEARPPLVCLGGDNGYGGRYVAEDGGGATVPVTYTIACDGDGAFRVTKWAYVLPAGQSDGYGGLTFTGFRMTDSSGALLMGGPAPFFVTAGSYYGSGGVAVTSAYECHTVAGSGAMGALVLSERRIWTGPCVSSSSSSYGVSTYSIPGTDETVSISEVP